MKGTWKKSGKASLSLLLAVLLLAGIGASASAADTGAGKAQVSDVKSGSIPVEGTYATLAAEPTIFVDISWEGMSFTYTPEHKGGWNPDEHNYDVNQPASWEASNSKKFGSITFTNKSDPSVTYGIYVTLKFAQNPATYEDGTIGLKWSTGEEFGDSAETYGFGLNSNSGDHNPSKTINVVPALGRGVTGFSDDKLGTITVTIELDKPSDPGLPGPGIESVQPVPGAGEIAANG